jgi:Big-like domain-containing protein
MNASRLKLGAALATAAALACLVPLGATATEAGNGTISDANKLVTWNGPPVTTPTATANCNGPNNDACSNFRLTIVPPAYPFTIEIKLQPFAAGDWDLQVYAPNGALAGSSGNAPSQLEQVTLVNPGGGVWTVSGSPFAPSPGLASYTASAELKPLPPPPPPPPPGGDNITYANYPAPNGLGQGAGEPSIGANWVSGRTMYQAGFETLRVDWDECSSPARDIWRDVSFPTTSITGLDPIGFCDSRTGRYFASQLTGQDSASAFTDNDGNDWTPSQGGGIPSGVDHQTFGGGKYHLPLMGGVGYANAVYYCSQEVVTAFCARSDNGGLTFGAGIPTWTVAQCGGLHGHVKVAPDDGTVYVPNKSCGGHQGVAVSEDNGLTWNVRTILTSVAGEWDPSIGIGSDGTVYMGWDEGGGHAKIAVSQDHGLNWSVPVDVGASLGVEHTVFPAVVAGDGDRAAFAFLGSTYAGPGGAGDDPNWPGEWHLYVAHTYNRGGAWTTVDVTPNDPVQKGTICAGGFNGCPNGTRNLLDFMDATVDKYGRVLVGYADGCLGACATGGPTSKSELATISRQVNGRRLFSQWDVAAPPDAPRVTAKADPGPPAVNHLSWDAPDDHGSAITAYKIYRRVSSTTTLLATLGGTVRTYDDQAGTNVFYRVTAVNGNGEGAYCEVAPTSAGGPPEDPCAVPGITVVDDPANDFNPAGSSKQDIRKVSVAGMFPGTPSTLVFSMKVDNLNGALPLNASWRIVWTSPNQTSYFVSMDTNVTPTNPSGAPQYSYGTFANNIFSRVGAADSGTFSADGQISITIDTSKIGTPGPGDFLTGLNGRSQLLIGAAGTGALAQIDSTGSGSYAIRTCTVGAPDAVDDSATTGENTAATINVLANDSDPENGPLTVTNVGQPAHGTATLNGNGSITYRPTMSFYGQDSFTYTIRDSQGLTDTATVRVTVTPFCPPVPSGSFNDTFEPAAKPGWTVNTAVNNLGPLSPAWQVVTDAQAHSPTHSFFSDATTLDTKDDRLVAPPQDLSSTSQLIFWHRFNFESGFDGGVLEVSNDGGSTWTDVLAGGGSFASGGYNGTIAANFGSPIAGRAAWTGGPVNAIAAPMSRVVVNLGAFAGTGVKVRFRLAADPLAVGSLPGQGWWIDDVQFTNTNVISQCNRPPIANDDTASTVTNTPVVVNVVANDQDPDSDALTVQSNTQPAHGSATHTSSSVTYTPASGYTGPDSFTYTINDGNGHTASATVTVTVSAAPNRAPDAVNDAATTQRNTPVAIPVLANDTDPDGDPLAVTGASDPPHGTAAVNQNGTITYTPDAGYTGGDSFTYSISDGRGGTDTATVSVTVNAPPNTAPTAVDDAATTPEGTAVTINVVANDTDPDGNSLTVTAVTQPGHGTATNNANGTVTYTPTAGYVGTDGFDYTISDGQGGSDTGHVNLSVIERTSTEGTKVTGGGSIPATGGSADANVNGQVKHGLATGKVSYTAPGISVKGSITSLQVAPATHARIGGPCQLAGGQPCRYLVEIDDLTESGSGGDRFSIRVFNGNGNVIHENNGLLTRGNFQVHA